jgi:hypothetical protein
MSLLIAILLLLIIMSLVLWAVSLLPLPSTPKTLISVLVILLAALWIAQRAGLL